MSAPGLEPDRGQIEIFFDALFRHGGHEGYASLRAFSHDNKPLAWKIWKTPLADYRHVIDVAVDIARRAANDAKPAVFCPPIAVFNGSSGQAREEDLFLGLAVSVECDEHPNEARQRLQEILGEATAIVTSGDVWINGGDEPEDKLHLHWRLAKPAKGSGDLAKLKRARDLAAATIGGDPSSKTIVHPLRWPGSFHRKDKNHPRLCELFSCNPDREIDLDEALAALEAAAPPQLRKGNGGDGEDPADWGPLIANIMEGIDFHDSLLRLTAKKVRAQANDGAIVNEVRALMEASKEPHDERWQARYDDIPRAVRGARAKYGAERRQPPDADPPPSPPTRPTITIEVWHTERIVDEIERLLIASDRRLFQRGSMVVTTGFAKMKTWDEKDVTVQVIEERGNHALLEDFERVANYQGHDRRGNLQSINPPLRLVLTLKDRKSRLRLPVITGIVNCPSISIRGELLDRPGYGADGVVFDPLGVEFPRVPDFPTKAIAETALKRVLRVLETFDFVGEDDKAVATSGIITAVARRGLPFAPAHGFDAPVAGSGKSKIVDIITIVATGRRAAVMDQGDEEEFRKAFGACLIRGDPMIAIDNCSHPVEGDLLNMSLTQEMVDVRILGQSKQVRVQTKAFVTLTGNNLNIVGDLTRRVINGRLDPKCERPELNQFDFDPIAYAVENRPQLVADCLRVLKAYHSAGRPDQLPRLQSFEHWSDTVRSALVWLGQGDPVRTMDRLRSNDPTLSNMVTVFSVWNEEFGEECVATSEVIERAEAHTYVEVPGVGSYPKQERQYTHSRLRNAVAPIAKKQGQLDAYALGIWLRKHKDRVVSIGDGLSVRMVTGERVKHRGVAGWILQRVA